jgi:hypothetical protein
VNLWVSQNLPDARRARRGALVAVLAIVSVPAMFVLGASAAAQPVVSAVTSPVSPYELTLTSEPIVAPGGTLSFAGICRDGSTQGTVRAVEVVGPEAEPFTFAVTIHVNGTTGAFWGSIPVPGGAPNGSYRLELSCGNPDVDAVHALNAQLIQVEGPPITTTSSTPLTVERHVPAAPPAAAPVPGTAKLTG